MHTSPPAQRPAQRSPLVSCAGIRVWGAHGQDALEHARICLLTAGPTGSEALKNMVLGGISSFTIVDGAKVGWVGCRGWWRAAQHVCG